LAPYTITTTTPTTATSLNPPVPATAAAVAMSEHNDQAQPLSNLKPYDVQSYMEWTILKQLPLYARHCWPTKDVKARLHAAMWGNKLTERHDGQFVPRR
jgi:hypothetical protein